MQLWEAVRGICKIDAGQVLRRVLFGGAVGGDAEAFLQDRVLRGMQFGVLVQGWSRVLLWRAVWCCWRHLQD